jgi:hypothetical protein
MGILDNWDDVMSGLIGYATAPLSGPNPAPTMQGLSGYNNAALNALPQGFPQGPPPPAPGVSQGNEPNPVTGGFMPAPNPPGVNAVPGNSQPPQIMPPDYAPGGANAAPNFGGPPGVQRLVDAATGMPNATDPLKSSTATLPGGYGGGSPTAIPTMGGAPPGSPQGLPSGLAGIVGGGPGATQVGTGNAVGSQGQFRPGNPPIQPPGTPVPGPTGPTPAPAASPVKPNFFNTPSAQNAAAAALGRGLENTAANWNKPAGAAFAAGMGGALTAGSAAEEKQRAQNFQQSSEAFKNMISAVRAGNEEEYRKAQGIYLRSRGETELAKAKAIAEGKYGKNGSQAYQLDPHSQVMAINAQIDKLGQGEKNRLQQTYNRGGMSKADYDAQMAEGGGIDQRMEQLKQNRYKQLQIPPEMASAEITRGLAKPYKAGDKPIPGMIYVNKDKSFSQQPGPNTESGVLPFQPKTQQQFDNIPAGAIFINPKDGKPMTKRDSGAKPAEEKTSAAEGTDYDTMQADQEAMTPVAEAA